MKKLSFKHTAHWLIFILANVLILFAACSKDSDNNDNGGNNNLPDPKPNIVTLNGAEKQITRAEYKDKGDDNYELYLYLNNSDKEKVELGLHKGSHMNGTPIELSEDDTTKYGLFWEVLYYSTDGQIIKASGHPDASHFTKGTLTVSGTPGSGSVNISLKKGKVMGKDDKEYTLTLNYSCEMEKK